MNCSTFKEKISMKLGAMELDAEEKEHLEKCDDCREYYESLMALESTLGDYAPEPLSEAEFSGIMDRVDEKVSGYVNRATGIYRWAVRYGVAASAVFLLVFISIFSNLPTTENSTDTITYYLSEYTGEVEMFSDSWIDDQYVDEAVGAWVDLNGIGSSELVVGDLSAEELQYLENNITLGGLL